MDKQKIIILFANKWSMIDQQTNQPKAGVSVQYVIADSLKGNMQNANTLGYRVAKASLDDINVFDKMLVVPGIYEMTASASVDGQGKVQMKLVDVDFVEALVQTKK